MTSEQAKSHAFEALQKVVELENDASEQKPKRMYSARMTSFDPKRESFRAFLRRFDIYAEANKLDPIAQKYELVANAVGAIDHILCKKDLRDWSISELVAECKERMCPDWSLPQVEQALYALVLDPQEDPEAVMRKIEELIMKADPSLVTRSQISALQCENFLRCISVHRPMHTYVRTKVGTTKDPKMALSLAKEYKREKGDDNAYMVDLCRWFSANQQVPTQMPTQPPTLLMPQTNLPGVPNLTSGTFSTGLAGTTPTQQPAAANQIEFILQMENESDSDFYARFLSKNEKVPMQEIIKRFNDLERFKRNVHQATMPDHLRNQNQGNQQGQKPWNNQNQNQNRNSSSNNNQNRPNNNNNNRGSGRNQGNNRDDKKKREKRYKKVEKEIDGKMQSFFVTDDEDDGQPDIGSLNLTEHDE